VSQRQGLAARPRSLRAALLALLATAGLELTAFAQGTGLEGSPELENSLGGLNYALHGFVLGDYTARVSGQNPPGLGDVSFAEERARLEVLLEASDVDAAARFKLDAFNDALVNRTGIELREAYVDYRTGPFDFRVGRQVLSWGVGDLQFVNDVFPKDYAAFFLGRPIEYLKVPNDALRTTLTFEPIAVDLVALPFFAPDGVPGRDRFVYGFDPFAAAPVLVLYPEATWENAEFAARLRVTAAETDIALYAYRGYFHSPSFVPDDPLGPLAVAAIFPALDVYGASLQRNVLGGVISAEAGYYHARDNARSDNPWLPTSRVKGLVGYQSELLTDLTVGAQYIGQLHQHYDTYRAVLPAGAPVLDEYVQTVTLRANLLLLHQTLRLAAFAFVGVTERDLLAMLEAEYRISDSLTLVVGSNIFAGERAYTTFGIFRENTNVYSWLKFSF
jgi:hypothetical protein